MMKCPFKFTVAATKNTGDTVSRLAVESLLAE